MRIAVCFACNEAYMPLCKGLVLSLKEAQRYPARGVEWSAHFIDIGCAPPSLAWLEEQGAALHVFRRREHYARQDFLPAYADAQLCRPFLPRIIPDHDAYLWIDSDFWLQSPDVPAVLAQSLADEPDKMVLCPEHHYGYITHRHLRNAVTTHRYWYGALYRDEALAEELAWRPILNSGLFALRAGHPLWEAWGRELAAIYAGDYRSDPAVLHYAEQLGLNRLLYEGKLFTLLDPLFNYACGGSAVAVTQRGKVCVGFPPYPPLKGVHLLAFGNYGRRYLDNGFLYRQGEYLAPEEREALFRLVKK